MVFERFKVKLGQKLFLKRNVFGKKLSDQINEII